VPELGFLPDCPLIERRNAHYGMRCPSTRTFLGDHPGHAPAALPLHGGDDVVWIDRRCSPPLVSQDTGRGGTPIAVALFGTVQRVS
jgi:hypothetical protein